MAMRTHGPNAVAEQGLVTGHVLSAKVKGIYSEHHRCPVPCLSCSWAEVIGQGFGAGGGIAEQSGFAGGYLPRGPWSDG